MYFNPGLLHKMFYRQYHACGLVVVYLAYGNPQYLNGSAIFFKHVAKSTWVSLQQKGKLLFCLHQINRFLINVKLALTN